MYNMIESINSNLNEKYITPINNVIIIILVSHYSRHLTDMRVVMLLIGKQIIVPETLHQLVPQDLDLEHHKLNKEQGLFTQRVHSQKGR